MNWNNNWDNGQFTHNQSASFAPIQATNPLDSLNQDQLLVLWADKKKTLSAIKEEEMDLRKYIVSRAFPNAEEGTNTLELGAGYELKAGVKYNYNLKAPEGKDTVQAVDDCVYAFSTIAPNEGSFIADRLFKYSVDLSLTEYRILMEDAKNYPIKKKLLDEVNKIIEIKDAAPTLEIKEPKSKKK